MGKSKKKNKSNGPTTPRPQAADADLVVAPTGRRRTHQESLLAGEADKNIPSKVDRVSQNLKMNGGGLSLNGTSATHQHQQQQQSSDPLGSPAKFATHSSSTSTAMNMNGSTTDASSFRVSMTEAQFKHALDRFGTEEEEEGEGQQPTRQRQHPSWSLPSTTTATSTANNSSSCSVMTGAVACLCSATLGAGILALPYAMAQAGILFGMGLLLASAIATAFSIQLLVQAMQVTYYYSSNNSQNSTSSNNNEATTTNVNAINTSPQEEGSSDANDNDDEKTYEDLVERCLGQTARRLAEASMLIFCGGGAVSYVIAVGDIVQQSGLLPHLFGSNIHPNMARTLAMTIVWCIAMVPLSMLKTMKSLECTSSIGIASIATLVVAALYHYLEHHTSGGTDSTYNTLLFDGDDHDISPPHHSILWPTQGALSILRACPIILFAFSCQVNVCAIYDEMKGTEEEEERQLHNNDNDSNNDEESPATNGTAATSLLSSQQPQQQPATNVTSKYRRMSWVTYMAVAICALLYSSISIIALLDFGSDHMTPNILSSYNPESVMQVAFVGMALAVVLAYPLNIFPARATVLGMCRRSSTCAVCCTGNKANTTANGIATATATTRRHGRTSMPVSNNQQETIPELEETTSNDLTEPLLAESPSATNNNNNNNDNKSETNENDTDDASFHTCSSVSPEHDEATLAISNVASPAVRNNINAALFQEITTSPSIDLGDSLVGHVATTLFLTGASLGLAIVAPNISVVFGLLGGTCTSVMGFILPGLLGYVTANDFYQGNDANRGAAARTRFLSILLVIAGVLIGIITTAVTVYSTFIAPQEQQHYNNSILTLFYYPTGNQS